MHHSIRTRFGRGLNLFVQAHEDDAQQIGIYVHAISDALADRQGITQQQFGFRHFHGFTVSPVVVNKNVQGIAA